MACNLGSGISGFSLIERILEVAFDIKNLWLFVSELAAFVCQMKGCYLRPELSLNTSLPSFTNRKIEHSPLC